MNSSPDDHPASGANVADADVSLGDGSALHRLEASRSTLRSAMQAHVRESSAPAAPRGTSRSLGQQLLELLRRLPVVRTVLAIRDFRRG